MDEAEHCHRLGFIQRGRLVALGSPESIKAEKMSGKVLEIDCAAPEAAMSVLMGTGLFEDVSLYGALIHLVTEDVQTHRPQVEQALQAEGVQVHSIDVIVPSLEDVFIASVRETP